ncbi:hypothetical protein, partial [Flavobacterium columnare]|uniref:hypothetical protein n=1 Tax=Flavobacterium columnare TaxID=996 RepID=UPI000CF69FD4
MAVLKKITKRNAIVLFVMIAITLGIASIYFYNRNEKVYTLKKYYPDTKTTDISQYVIRNGDTVFHGKYISYNQKGIKISEVNFVDGDIKGKCFYYYDNGKIESIQFKANSKINFEGFWYYHGVKIKSYTMYSNFGAPIFIIDYNAKNEVDNYKGSPQLEVKQHYVKNHQYKQIKNSFTLGETLKYSYIIANIPKTKRSIKIENISVDNSKVKRTLKHIEPCQWDVEEVLTKKGKNTIQSIVKYEFKDKV